MNTIQAVMTDPQASHHIKLIGTNPPVSDPHSAIVEVRAFSLNRGEVRRAFTATTQYIPGWDLAGIVRQPAADGSGPKAGARVVGFLHSGAWAEQVAVPTHALAQLPAEVSFSQAATLPVAGLTALYSLQKTGSLLGRKVLVTGASGGVGDFAVQLAYRAGATVTGTSQHQEYVSMVEECGASQVVVGDVQAAMQYGPYDLICDGVGGQTLSAVAAMLAPGGLCVTYAAALQSEVGVQLRPLFQSPSPTLTGLLVLTEVNIQPASIGLARLAGLVADGRLKPHISVETSWNQVAETCQQLIDRKFPGKAVLHVNS